RSNAQFSGRLRADRAKPSVTRQMNRCAFSVWTRRSQHHRSNCWPVFQIGSGICIYICFMNQDQSTRRNYRNELATSSTSFIGPLERTGPGIAGIKFSIPYPPTEPETPSARVASLPKYWRLHLFPWCPDINHVVNPVTIYELGAVPISIVEHQQPETGHVAC